MPRAFRGERLFIAIFFPARDRFAGGTRGDDFVEAYARRGSFPYSYLGEGGAVFGLFGNNYV